MVYPHGRYHLPLPSVVHWFDPFGFQDRARVEVVKGLIVAEVLVVFAVELIGTDWMMTWYVLLLMLAPEPRLSRNRSRASSSFSHSAVSEESSLRSKPPLRMSVVALSFGCGGLGSGAAAQTVLRASLAFIGRVAPSMLPRLLSSVLSESVRTCRHLISSRLRICICEYDTFGVIGRGLGGRVFGVVAVTWL